MAASLVGCGHGHKPGGMGSPDLQTQIPTAGLCATQNVLRSRADIVPEMNSSSIDLCYGPTLKQKRRVGDTLRRGERFSCVSPSLDSAVEKTLVQLKPYVDAIPLPLRREQIRHNEECQKKKQANRKRNVSSC